MELELIRKYGLPVLIGAVLSAAPCFLLGDLHGRSAARASFQASQNKAEVAAIQTEATASAAAAGELAAGTAQIAAAVEEQQHAVQNLPDNGLDARQRARVCVVLKQQGLDAASLAKRGCGAPS